MRFSNVLHTVLVEEVKNKKLFNDLLSKWRLQNAELTPNEVELLFNRFQEIKNGLGTNKPQVVSFLYRFDGNHGYEKFDPDLLKDITKYTYRQIRSLIDEYTDDEGLGGGQLSGVFDTKDLKSTKEKVIASKELWESNSAIINEDGFRVYLIKDQAMSIRFGYYLEHVRQGFNKEPGTNSRWCVTWRGTREDGDGGTNMWGSYRSDGKTFYFVIDESRGEKDKYYMAALQKTGNNRDGYVITSVKNDGDLSKSWHEIIQIYPKLEQHKDKLITIPYSTDELEEKGIVGQISEVQGSQYEFKRVDRQFKKAYINNQGVLKKPESWASIDDKLRSLYIATTTTQLITNKFSNFEFINEIKKVGNEFTQLDNKLKQLGHRDGIGFVLSNLIKHEFRITRESLTNPQIKIYESRANGLYGIYSDKQAGWIKFDNIVYEPLFKQTETDAYFDEDEMGHLIEKYEKRGGEGVFYAVFPSETERGDCYILSQKKWEELKPRLFVDKESIPRIKDFNPDSDVDIKEIKKGS